MPTKKAEGDTQPLKFVNISCPVVFDKDTKTVIRSYVSGDLQRRKRRGRTSVRPTSFQNAICMKTVQTHPEELTSNTISFSQQLFTSLGSFPIFPVNMEPYMYQLIHRCKYILSKHHRYYSLTNAIYNRRFLNLQLRSTITLNSWAGSPLTKLASSSNDRRGPLPLHPLWRSTPH